VVNQEVNARIDVARRNAIRLNHTATHLLHAALKTLVGSHVQHKGSFVDAERARFDFSHFEALTPTQLRQLEVLVNEKIRANDEVVTEIMSIEEAKKSGAVALFGEKYGDSVRVLSLGEFSKELCGGTHASRTGDIGLFKITAEYGIASGIRRIEMVTGAYALSWVNQQLEVLEEIAVKLKTNPVSVPEKLSQFLHEVKQQEKELARLNAKIASISGADLLAEVQTVQGVNLLVKQLDNMDNQTLRTTLDQLKSSLDNAVIVLIATSEEKMNVVAGVSKSLLGLVPTAATLVKHLCGKGGGREDMAQGGGRVPEDLDQRISQIRAMIAEHAG
ncbi:DHHA1 domain-containing protein, partial [Legionella sp.]|uniref:DHHA1 domain-containing protein n=1 Tax=Legionella sp. TaxID=459 RepID=UPI00321FE62A